MLVISSSRLHDTECMMTDECVNLGANGEGEQGEGDTYLLLLQSTTSHLISCLPICHLPCPTLPRPPVGMPHLPELSRLLISSTNASFTM